MIRRSFLLSSLGLVAAATPIPPLSADEIADRVHRCYERSRTFRAAFKQYYRVEMYRPSASQGSVVCAKPGKMSWRYTNNGNRVVCDGQLVKVYEKADQRMYEQPRFASQFPAALSFFVAGASFKTSFEFSRRSEAPSFEGRYVIAGVPREASPAYRAIVLYVDAGTYQVRRVLLLDSQGNRTRFDFSNAALDIEVPAAEFSFTPPAGTQVIRP